MFLVSEAKVGSDGELFIDPEYLKILKLKTGGKLVCIFDGEKIILSPKKGNFPRSFLEEYMKSEVGNKSLSFEDARKALSSIKEPLSNLVSEEREER